MLVRFHRLALAEYRRVIARYLQEDEEVAVRFIRAVEIGAERIEEDPHIGTPCHERFHWLRVKKFKYLLYYGQISDTIIQIFAVAHASRRPGYWLRRTRQP